MKIEVSPSIDVLHDSIRFLQHFSGKNANKSLPEIIRESESVTSLTKDDEVMLVFYQDFIDHLRNEVALTVEEIDLLMPDFTDHDKNNMLSSVLFPLQSEFGLTLEGAVETICATDEGVLRGFFLSSAANDEAITPGSFVSMNDFLQKVLNTTEWSGEGRCHIITTFLDYHASFTKAAKVVKRMMDVLEKALPTLQPKLDDWHKQTAILLEDGIDSPFFTRILKLVPVIQTHNLTMIIRPSIAACATMGIFITHVDYPQSEYLFPTNPKGSICLGLALYDLGVTNLSFMRDQMLPTELLLVLKVLSDKSKFDILTILRDESCYAAQLATRLNLSPATISYHMSTLVSNQLVIVGIEDKKVCYQLNTEQMKRVTEGLAKTFLKA